MTCPDAVGEPYNACVPFGNLAEALSLYGFKASPDTSLWSISVLEASTLPLHFQEQIPKLSQNVLESLYSHYCYCWYLLIYC